MLNEHATQQQVERLGEGIEHNAMLLYDAYQPGLRAGHYRVVVSQDIAVGDSEKHSYFQDQNWVVSGPRFRIDPQDVHAFYPPNGARGPFSQVLPHVVFRKRALPWERYVDRDGTKPSPWLAVFLLSEKELQQAGPSVLKSLPLGQLNPAASHSQSSILGPHLLDEGHSPDQSISVVDLPVALFKSLLPTLDELRYLAHLRCVSASQKTPLEMHANGDFSVLVANRFPQSGSHIALVVSLEGWGSTLANPNSLPSHITHVRLLNPLTWRFNNDEEGSHTFNQLLEGLDLDSFGQERDTGCPELDARLRKGLVPVAHPGPDGENSFAWYRGPFSPSSLPSSATHWEPIVRSEDAMRWDPTTGTLDISYAAAWQLGRLLALESDHFTKGLRTFLGEYHHATEAAERLAQFLKTHQNDPVNNVPPRTELARTLSQWLARLMLLYPVPFHYLIPNESLLPPQTLRFFHVDPRWLAALTSGALSAGLQCRFDGKATRDQDLLYPLSKIMTQYRQHILGEAATEATAWNFTKDPMTGFFLRSKLITDWPGLEVVAETKEDTGSRQATLLRFDQLGDGIMFGLVRGSLSALKFQEPREGLSFGLSADGHLIPRDLTQPGKDLSSLQLNHVKEHFTRKQAMEGVLKVQAFAEEIAKQIAPHQTGAAFLALQLIRAPQVHTVTWSQA